MQSKSKDTREAAINAVMNKTLSVKEAAKVFRVSISTIYYWISHYRKTGSYEARISSGRPPVFTDEHKAQLAKLIEEKNDLTLDEIVILMGNIVQRSSISYYLNLMGYSYKKNSKGFRAKSS